MWHQFTPRQPEDARSECTACEVVIDNGLAEVITLGCPVAPCKDPSNHDDPCVFVVAEGGPECAYCARPGDPDSRDEVDEDDGLLLMMPWTSDAVTGLDLR